MKQRIGSALKHRFTPIDAAEPTRTRSRICERDMRTIAGLKHFAAVTSAARVPKFG